MKHYGLIGYPLSHSFSKKYFEEKFIKESIYAEYLNFEIRTCDELNKLISTNSLDGLNVTIPHKKEVIKYLTHISDEAKEIGAVNCIQIKNHELFGHNTDVIGFEKSILETTSLKHKKALVFGTGGASKAVSYVLTKHHVSHKLVSRNDIQYGLTYHEIDESILAEFQLLINTTPVGMYPLVDTELPIPYRYVTKSHVAFDLIYNPEKTNFLSFCEAEGATIQNGMNMLIYQAEESYKLFTQ